MKKYLYQIRKIWPWYKGLYQNKKWYTKTIVGILSFVVAFIIYLVAVDINFLFESNGISAATGAVQSAADGDYANAALQGTQALFNFAKGSGSF